MNFQSTATTLRTHIFASWALTPLAAIPMVAENRANPTDATLPWIRVAIVPFVRDAVSFGNIRTWRTTGAVYFQIFVPTGEGDGLAREIADTIGSFLEGTTLVSTILIRSVTFTGTIGVDGMWTQYGVRADYSVDELK